MLWEDDLLPFYSLCCGDALTLPNGDVAFDVNSPNFSYIEEVIQSKDLGLENELLKGSWRIAAFVFPAWIRGRFGRLIHSLDQSGPRSDIRLRNKN